MAYIAVEVKEVGPEGRESAGGGRGVRLGDEATGLGDEERKLD